VRRRGGEAARQEQGGAGGGGAGAAGRRSSRRSRRGAAGEAQQERRTVISLTSAPLVRTQCSRKRRKWTERGALRSMRSSTGLAYLSRDAVKTTTSNCRSTPCMVSPAAPRRAAPARPSRSTTARAQGHTAHSKRRQQRQAPRRTREGCSTRDCSRREDACSATRFMKTSRPGRLHTKTRCTVPSTSTGTCRQPCIAPITRAHMNCAQPPAQCRPVRPSVAPRPSDAIPLRPAHGRRRGGAAAARQPARWLACWPT
jgi:hypothetical protein